MANYRTFPYKLPSGNDITFREPFNRDREHVMQYLKEGGPSPDELLASHCIIAINGAQLQFPDPRHNMANWGVKDSTAFLTLFMEMFSLSRDEVEEIRLAAKKLKELYAQPAAPTAPAAYATPSAPMPSPQPPAPVYSASPAMAASTQAQLPSQAASAATPAGAITIGSEDGSEWQIEPSLLATLEQDSTGQT